MMNLIDDFNPMLFLYCYLGVMLLGYIVVLLLIIKDYYKD